MFITNGLKRTLVTSSEKLFDQFNRRHNYLRISLTERCNLRCLYCMPEEGIKLAKKDSYLNLNELNRLTNIFVSFCEVDKIRLTGGEPTIDNKLVPMLENLNRLRELGLKTVALTTNGLTLKRKASLYKSLGLNAINVSLDTLNKNKYQRLTRVNGFNLAYEGLMSALNCDFDKVKLNCVVMKGFNEDEIYDFVKLAYKYPIEVRFIEFMPFEGNKWSIDKLLPYNDIVKLIMNKFPEVKHVVRGNSRNEVSKLYRDNSMLGSIGFISSMTDNFCSGCNRLRLTADGSLKVCLFGREETSLRDLIRNGATDLELIKATKNSLLQKKRQHAGMTNLMQDTMRPMIKIASRKFHSTPSKLAPFSHLDAKGSAKMVDVGGKPIMLRIASAQGVIQVGPEVLDKLDKMKKGDVITVAKVAGLLGAKSTSQLIPMCHQIALNNVQIDIEICKNSSSLIVTSSVEAHHRTGVEMESLVAVSITLLTLYDMCKSVNKSMVISEIKLISKSKRLPD